MTTKRPETSKTAKPPRKPKKPKKVDTTRLWLEVEYDPKRTDPESLAVALDRLLETALSTPGFLVGQLGVEGTRSLMAELVAVKTS